MSGHFDWEKTSRNKRLHYTPSQRSRAASNRQLKYIVALCRDKGQPVPPRLPKTMQGAGEMIERLLVLPDAKEHAAVFSDVQIVAPEPPKPTARQELVAELRHRFPQLTPMSVNSLVQLFEVIDPIGMAFILDGLIHEDTPSDPHELLLHILRRFLDQIAPVSADDTALVSGYRPN